MPIWLYYSQPKNLAFHNLCLLKAQLPPTLSSLLGLGLKFCPRPLYSNNIEDVQLNRFHRDCCTRMFFAGDNTGPPPKLFIRSDWRPDPKDIPLEFRARLSEFIERVGQLSRRRRRVKSNLLPTQLATLNWLKTNKDFVIFPTDKNLGPAIMERDRYIAMAFNEHLNDVSAYRRIDATTALRLLQLARENISKIIRKLKYLGKGSDAKFLERSCEVSDPYAYFYLLAKVHKTPLKTRPIVSTANSLLRGLGIWVDYYLQMLCKDLRYRAKSSGDLVSDLRSVEGLPPTTRLFTCDATSMYTNIDTTHALSVLGNYLRGSLILYREKIPLDLFMLGLRTVMIYNVFRFGDTFWIQLKGTAMGASPAPMYATLYFAILEQQVVPKFPECQLYTRYIDDGFGIWIPSALKTFQQQQESWNNFVAEFNNASTLEWTFSEHHLSVNFLDLTISLADDGRLRTRIYEKALNLYLYLPSTSCHPRGVLKGLIHGMMLRFFRLSSDPMTAQADVRRLLQRLVARGYAPRELNHIMKDAYQSLLKRRLAATVPQQPELAQLYLHLPFHPGNPSSREIQKIFTETMANPPGKCPLAELQNSAGCQFDEHRLIVAFSRQRNLGNIFPHRKLCSPGDP